MPKRKKVDSKKLVQMISSGKPQKDILKAFGFSNSTQLKVAYANALMEVGTAPVIKASKKATNKAKPTREVKVSKRGSVSIPPKMISELGFNQGDEFTVRRTKAGISLKKV